MDFRQSDKSLFFDGLTLDELSQFSREEMVELLDIEEPILFKVGDAQVLAQFDLKNEKLGVFLSSIEDGGDGTLFHLLDAIESLSRQHGLNAIDWEIDAVHCTKPNSKLQRILRGYGFEIDEGPEGRSVFRKTTSTNDTVMRRAR